MCVFLKKKRYAHRYTCMLVPIVPAFHLIRTLLVNESVAQNYEGLGAIALPYSTAQHQAIDTAGIHNQRNLK